MATAEIPSVNIHSFDFIYLPFFSNNRYTNDKANPYEQRIR